MTVPAIKAVGFCPHASPQGEWAFEYALDLARAEGLQLDILVFLADPFAQVRRPPPPRGKERARLAVDLERDARLHFEDRLGDYLNVGCRVCEEDEWHELHRCLSRHEFQVLVLPYPSAGTRFGGKPIEEFAETVPCPVILVGPTAPNEFRLNGPAALRSEHLRLELKASVPAPPPDRSWARIGEPALALSREAQATAGR